MTTKKDLVEAHAFSRRRLVTAFLSGAPGGREVEPARPGRTIVGGVAVAVLLLAGAAIASVLSPRAPQGWNSQGLVVTDQGARYVVTQDNQPLRPVVNLTSAQLILGLEPSTQVVSQSTVNKETPGAPIGIEGAPEELPTTSHFVESGWTACTRDGAGVAVDISRTPQIALTPSQGFVVTASSGTWLIAETLNAEGEPEAYRYRIPAKDKDLLIQNVFTAAPTVSSVPESWVELFPEGTPLGAGGFPPSDGEPSTMEGANGAPLVTGDIVTSGGKYYLVRKDGWMPLSDFAAQVYLSIPGRSGRTPTPQQLPSLTGPRSSQSQPTTSWPTDPVAPPTKPVLCTKLNAHDGAAPSVRIGTSTGTSAWPAETPKADGSTVQTVDPGMGAFVYTGSFESAKGTTAYMVDSRGEAFLLEGGSTISTLGLDSYKAPVIPDTWLEVLGTGTPLSTERALCPPSTEPSGKSGKCAPAAS